MPQKLNIQYQLSIIWATTLNGNSVKHFDTRWRTMMHLVPDDDAIQQMISDLDLRNGIAEKIISSHRNWRIYRAELPSVTGLRRR
jgi:hypothetical protein